MAIHHVNEGLLKIVNFLKNSANYDRLGGRAVEQRVFNEVFTTGAADDLVRVSDIACAMGCVIA